MENLEAFSIDVEEIIEDLQLRWEERGNQYNKSAFSKVKTTSDNIMFCCPYHDETNPSAGMMKEYPYIFNCFGCGASANLTQLVTHALGYRSELMGEYYITKNYVAASILERRAFDIESLLDERGQARKISMHEADIEQYLTKRHSYMYNRGFSDHTLNKYEIGYDEQTQSITFPVRTSKGDVRFIKKRFVARKGFLNLKGIDKKDIIYGLYYIIHAPNQIDTIYLNESETDTMACYQSGLAAGAILGRILFTQQINELLKAGIKTINLFFDNDKHGVECTIKSYLLLSKLTPIRVNVVVYPCGHYGIDSTDDQVFKDANDLMNANAMGEIQVIAAENFIRLLKYRNELDVEW